jgi:glycosyltransferase involved in cell wall biosynthesis
MKPNNYSYVLITPARNEEANIERTIKSVIAQSVLPKKWVIVSDGSTDLTDEIVKKYLNDYPWMELLRLSEHRDRSFAAKVNCFNAGYEKVRDLQYEVIGNLDGDISFDESYLQFLIEKFQEIPELGVAGTPFVEDGYSTLKDSFEGEKHVAGGCQLFRRRCFEEIDGYIANRAGGIDWIAVTTARMKGWTTRSFREKVFYHHRSLGTGGNNRIGAIFDYGKKDYYLGGHPLWEFFRVLYRLSKKPFLLGGIALISGYLWAFASGMKRPVSDELMKFHRREQMQKLKALFRKALRFKKMEKFESPSQ